MKHYAVAEITITDPSWIADYVRDTTPLVERFGGRYLARTSNVGIVEGDRPVPQICLLIEWPSKGAAMAFYDSEEYRPHREARRAGSTGEFVIVAGEDDAGVAQIA